MEQTIEVSKDLWLVTEESTFSGDGLFHICDGVGGDTLVDIAEVPQLIEALQKVQEQAAHASRLPKSRGETKPKLPSVSGKHGA